MRFRAPCLTVLAAILLLSTPVQVRAADPFDINVMVEQTGFFALYGTRQTEAYRAIEASVNRNGGIQGRPLRFVFHDDASSPQVALQIANQLISDKVQVILGPSLSGNCAAIYPLVQQTGPVVYCISPGVQPPAGGYAFRAGPPVEDAMPTVVRYFYRRGIRNIALLATSDTSGQIWDQSLTSTLARPEFKDVKLVAREFSGVADISVTAQVARIKAAQPQVIFALGSGTAFGAELRAIYDAGLDLPVLTSGVNMNVPQLRSYAGFMVKELDLYATQGLLVNPAANPGVRAAQADIAKIMKDVGKGLETPYLAVFDPTMVVVNALRKFGTGATSAQIKSYIEGLRNFPGAAGVYNFTLPDRLQTGIRENGGAVYRYVQAKEDWELLLAGS